MKNSHRDSSTIRRTFGSVLLTAVLLCLLCTGCWNRRELNEIAIASAMGFDIDNKGGPSVSVQVIEPGEVQNRTGGGSAGRAPVTMYEANEETVMQTIRSITRASPRKIYLSHLRIVVISEELARRGVREVIDFLSRDHELRRDFFILVAKGSRAREVLNIITTIEKIPANKMYNSLKVAEESWAPVMGVNLEDFISSLVKVGQSPLLPGISISGNKKQGEMRSNVEHIDSPARLSLEGLAVFKQDRMLGWLNEEEGVGANFMLDQIKSTVLQTACPGEGKGKAGSEIIRSDTRLGVRVEQDKPVIEVTVRSEANVADVECALNLRDKETITQLEEALNKRVEELISKALRAAQKKYKTDIFGFGDVIHRKQTQFWDQIKEQWPEMFPEVQVEVKVSTKIRRTGTVNNSFIQEIKE